MESIKTEKSYRKLLMHQKADELALASYKATSNFPKEEMFGITSQIRRSAVSVPANIAEGYMRQGVSEKIRFYNIAQGSLVELEYFIEFSNKLNYLSEKTHKELCDLKNTVGKLINGYIKGIKTNLKVESGN